MKHLSVVFVNKTQEPNEGWRVNDKDVQSYELNYCSRSGGDNLIRHVKKEHLRDRVILCSPMKETIFSFRDAIALYPSKQNNRLL